MIDPHGLEEKVEAGELRLVRQSTLSTADTCLKQLEYELDRSQPYQADEFTIIGTGYHAGLEARYRARKEGDLLVLEDVIDNARVAFDNELEKLGREIEWHSTPEAAWERVVHSLTSYFTYGGEWPLDYEVLMVEETFLLPFVVEGWAIKGTMDLVLRAPNGQVIIIDHKTARRRWKKDKHTPRVTNQPAWYVRWFKELTGEEDVLFVFDIMLPTGELERRPAPVKPVDEHLVMEKAKAVVRLIEQDGPFLPNTQSYLCKAEWCDWWDQCPWGQAMEDGVIATVPVSLSVTKPTEEAQAA